jgi:hypothetical protein
MGLSNPTLPNNSTNGTTDIAVTGTVTPSSGQEGQEIKLNARQSYNRGTSPPSVYAI